MRMMGVTVRVRLATLMVGALVLAGCSGTSGTGSTKAQPFVARGRPSINLPGTVTLTWIAPTENTNGTPLTDLAGYHIRYGTDPAGLSKTIDLSSTNTTAYEITGLSPGTYYFAISAYTAEGSESAQSDVGYKTI